MTNATMAAVMQLRRRCLFFLAGGGAVPDAVAGFGVVGGRPGGWVDGRRVGLGAGLGVGLDAGFGAGVAGRGGIEGGIGRRTPGGTLASGLPPAELTPRA